MTDLVYDRAESQRAMSTPKELCLLSLDGGGVRGLSTLMILKRIMEAINPEDPPNPCDYFHMICGTSTGGLIALMLGRLRMTVDQCIEAYNEMSPEVFTKIHHRVNLKNGKSQGRFDHEAMESHVKALVTERLINPNELLKDSLAMGSCKTFVCVTSQRTSRPVILSSYYNERRGTDMLNITKIWEAARATSAATTFFEPITIGDETFIDGATGANNPVRYMLAEARDVFNNGKALAEDDYRCILSIGTGIPSLTAFGPGFLDVGEALKAIATDTEEVADSFRKDYTSLFSSPSPRAFRFNVLRGLETIGLEEVSKWGDIKSATRLYVQMEEVHTQIKECARNLKERDWVKRLRQNILTLISPSITTLHDDETHPSMGELQWLTHTKAYQGWKSSESGIIWYRPPSKIPDDTRKGIAAAVAYHTSTQYQSFAGTELGVGPMMSRTLYHQCDRRQAGDDFDPENSDYSSPEDVLWSLICQCLIMDCKTISSLSRRLSQLPEESRRALQEAMAGQKSQPIPMLFNILTLAIQACNSTMMLALDNVHLLQGTTSPTFWNTLRSFMSMMRPRNANHTISALISGCRSSSLEEYLQGIAIVDDETEREECLQSLHFPEWNTRRDQVAEAEKGTNEWLWSHDQYRRWEIASSAILWIEGKPGSGKSVLAKSLQRRLSSAHSHGGTNNAEPNSSKPDTLTIVRSKIPDSKHVADWFYSTRLGPVGMAHLSLLRSILYQLLQQNDRLFELAAAFYRRKSVLADVGQSWDAKECEQVLEHICKSGVEVVCIIDAMDESADAMIESQAKMPGNSKTGTILQTLWGLGSGLRGSKMKFVVLSRPDAFIEMDFKKIRRTTSETYKIVLEWENQKDIDMIINKGLGTLRRAIDAFDSDSEDDTINSHGMRKYRGLPSPGASYSWSQAAALKSIGDFLRRYAEGVILWVNLVIGELEDLAHGGLVSLPELESHAKKLPRHLEEDGLYEHIVQKLQQRRQGADIPRARSTFMLLLGSAVIRRPLRVRELWEALAVPASLDDVGASKTDPIKCNRARIKSWTSFRRHLRMICGPFIEIIRGQDLPYKSDYDDIGPEDVVQFTHRTVKDFLQVEGRSGQLHFSEEEAVDHTNLLAKTYLEVSFPKHQANYGPQASRWKIDDWLQNLYEYVEYLQERILLQFCLFVFRTYNPYCAELAYLLQSKTFVLLQQCPYISEEVIVSEETRQLYPAFNTEHRRSATILHEAIAMGECVRNASSRGFVIATQNLLEICSMTTSTFSTYALNGNIEQHVYAVKNGALATAVTYNLVPQVRTLTKAHRHQGGLVSASITGWPIGRGAQQRNLDPFIRFAVNSGSVETVDFLFDHTDRMYARNAAIREFAVTSRELAREMSEPLSQKFRERQSSCSASSLDSVELVRLGLVDRHTKWSRPDRRKRRRHRGRDPLAQRDTKMMRRSNSNNMQLKYAKLKDTCLQLAMDYRPTVPKCDMEDIKQSLELVMSISADFEPNTNPYSSEAPAIAHGSDDEYDQARNLQPDAYRRFLNRNTVEIRHKHPLSETSSLSSGMSSRSRSPISRSRQARMALRTDFNTFSNEDWEEEDISDDDRPMNRDNFTSSSHREEREARGYDDQYRQGRAEDSRRSLDSYEYDSDPTDYSYNPYRREATPSTRREHGVPHVDYDDRQRGARAEPSSCNTYAEYDHHDAHFSNTPQARDDYRYSSRPQGPRHTDDLSRDDEPHRYRDRNQRPAGRESRASGSRPGVRQSVFSALRNVIAGPPKRR